MLFVYLRGDIPIRLLNILIKWEYELKPDMFAASVTLFPSLSRDAAYISLRRSMYSPGGIPRFVQNILWSVVEPMLNFLHISDTVRLLPELS